MTDKANEAMTTSQRDKDVTASFERVEAEVVRACADCDRAPESVTLIAVSKTFPAEDIVPVLAQGHRVFGENYVQETAAKWPDLRSRYPNAELHLIGPLQSNKVHEAVALFDVIHSLDRPSLAKALAKEFAKTDKRPRLLVQVNTGEEPQKGGVIPTGLADFLKQCRDEYGLDISGLMCIPPVEEPPSPHFALLAKLAERHGLPLLSMGMSADFEAAIQLGATHVRIGSAIFGARTYPAREH